MKRIHVVGRDVVPTNSGGRLHADPAHLVQPHQNERTMRETPTIMKKVLSWYGVWVIPTALSSAWPNLQLFIQEIINQKTRRFLLPRRKKIVLSLL